MARWFAWLNPVPNSRLSYCHSNYDATEDIFNSLKQDLTKECVSGCFREVTYNGSYLQRPIAMLKRSKFETTQSQIMHRAEELIDAASNRYRITVQVANRAKRRRYEDFDNVDDPMMKPVIRAIIEMSDELTQPEIIGE